MPGSSQHMCLRLHRFPSINNNAWSAIVARPLCIPAGFQLSSAATRAAFALVSLLCLLLRRRRCLCFALGLSLCAATFWEISLIFSWKPGLLCVAGRVKDTHTHTHTLMQSAQQIKIQRQRQKQGQAKEEWLQKGASWQTGTCYVDRARNVHRHRSFWH